ncbi:MAG: MBOAT family protein [Paludibacteraceae bacterium]|nr:MBOAT family protein [Paludibacteraceae bacterium]
MRNVFLLVASYVFYGWWDYRFLLLIFSVSLLSFVSGRCIDAYREDKRKSKMILWANIVVNLLLLGYFKYVNFFIDSARMLLSLLHIQVDWPTLNVILPVGISFYTFQALSYTIDVYKEKVQATKDVVSYFTYIAFFPQLIAGPIERASNMLPQFSSVFKFDYDKARSGLLLIAVGLVKKMVIADRLAVFVDGVWGNLHDADGLSLVVGLLFFSFQLYLDFSAYSQIAIGTARLFGFELMQNFNSPYLSVSFADFWKKWHISLTSWFRDYLYIPLGGNRKGVLFTYLNIFIIFLVSGLWHGASWTFVVWGCLNGIFLIINKLAKWNPTNFFTGLLGAVVTFSLWTLSLSFFRSQSISDAFYVLANMGASNSDALYDFGLNSMEFGFVSKMLVALMVLELLIEKKGELFYKVLNFVPIRWIVYILLPLAIVYLGVYGASDNSFIYFQF